MAFTSWKVAVFVDGAFRYGHPDHFNWQPPQNTSVTRSTDSDRDRLADEALRVAGCTEIRFWDFQLKEDQGLVVDRIMDALDTAG